MRIHIHIKRPRLREFHLILTEHLLEDRRLAVDDLVVGKRQQVSLPVKISHGESQLIVVPSPVQRICPEIFQSVIHPAHIPFIVKSKPAFLRQLCHPRETRGVLRRQND